jgi:hypothetical protein
MNFKEDSLIGELTAREVTTITAALKRGDSLESISKDGKYYMMLKNMNFTYAVCIYEAYVTPTLYIHIVTSLLDKLGLSHVADGIIGTLIFVRILLVI